MKYAIIIAMLAGSAMGQESVIVFTDGSSSVASSTNTIKVWHPQHGISVANIAYSNIYDWCDAKIEASITNGTVCRIRGGHLWNDKWSGRERGWQSDGRQCQICNLYQKRKEVWEDGR